MLICSCTLRPRNFYGSHKFTSRLGLELERLCNFRVIKVSSTADIEFMEEREMNSLNRVKPVLRPQNRSCVLIMARPRFGLFLEELTLSIRQVDKTLCLLQMDRSC